MNDDMLPIDLGKLTDVGQTRSHNEDSIQTWHSAWDDKNGGRLFIVADGVGGESHGDIASQLTVQNTGYLYYEAMRNNPKLPVRGTLIEVINQVNQIVYQEAERRNAAGHMASTIVAAVLRGNRLSIAWLGDSRAYLLQQSQPGIQQITQDHSQVEEQYRAGLLTAEQAANHPAKNILSRSVGGRPNVIVDSVEYEVKDGDILIICSDGLTRHVNDQELGKITRGSPDSQTAARTLVQLANQRGGRDNISAVVIYVGQRGSSTAIYGVSTDVPFDERDTDPGLVTAQPGNFLEDGAPSEAPTFDPAMQPSFSSPTPPPTTQQMYPPQFAPVRQPRSGRWGLIIGGILILLIIGAVLLIAGSLNDEADATPGSTSSQVDTTPTNTPEPQPTEQAFAVATNDDVMLTGIAETATYQSVLANNNETATEVAHRTEIFATRAAYATETAVAPAENVELTQQANQNAVSMTTVAQTLSAPLPVDSAPDPSQSNGGNNSSGITGNTNNGASVNNTSWDRGTRLRVIEATELLDAVGNPSTRIPVNANTIVTVIPQRITGDFQFTQNDEIWWHVLVSGIGPGWLPESVLEQEDR